MMLPVFMVQMSRWICLQSRLLLMLEVGLVLVLAEVLFVGIVVGEATLDNDVFDL